MAVICDANARWRSRLLQQNVTSVMGGYYVYVVGDDGHFQKRIEIVCEDDDEAIRRARRLVDGHAIELWQEDRMVETFKPER